MLGTYALRPDYASYYGKARRFEHLPADLTAAFKHVDLSHRGTPTRRLSWEKRRRSATMYLSTSIIHSTLQACGIACLWIQPGRFHRSADPRPSVRRGRQVRAAHARAEHAVGAKKPVIR